MAKRARVKTRTRTIIRRVRSARARVGRRGTSKKGILGMSLGRTAARAVTFNIVNKVAPTQQLGRYALPANLAISGFIDSAVGMGGKHKIQTAVEIAGSRALDQFVLGKFLGGGNGGGARTGTALILR